MGSWGAGGGTSCPQLRPTKPEGGTTERSGPRAILGKPQSKKGLSGVLVLGSEPER